MFNDQRFVSWLVVGLFAVSLYGVLPAGADHPDTGPVHVLTNAQVQPDHEGGYDEFDCDPEVQLALLVTDHPGCGDFGGEHTLLGFGLVFMGFRSQEAGNVGPVPLTGTIQALLEWSGGEVELLCTWDEGEIVGCEWNIGAWPTLGSTFEFSCQSLQGSIGNWGECFIGHQ